jgi:DtxR family Mn-dependent transcriptional regulator
MDRSIHLSASMEDYLEAIFRLAAEKGAAKARDISRKLHVKAGSVTGALQALSKKDYINYAPYEVITLTSKGLEEARKIIRKHEILRDFFVNVLGIDEKTADKGACGLEHNIPQPIVDRLATFCEFVETCPRAGKDWSESFAEQCKSKQERRCVPCLEQNYNKFQKGQAVADSNNQTTLAEMKPKEKGVVLKITKRATVTKRLVEMGIGKGAVITVERIAPLGDPIDVKVRGYHLSLRKEEAVNIIVRL